jgi:acetate kinase
MKLLVLNSGSSSIKYELFEIDTWKSLASGQVERIGESESQLCHWHVDATGRATTASRTVAVADHQQGIAVIAGALREFDVIHDTSELYGIGHRVVHGGETFREPALVDEQVLAAIRAQIPLAPLHNPANVVGIEATMAYCPEVPQVAVFDTAFHQSIPQHAYRYAVPETVYTSYGVRRYGFHGTSHHYVAKRAADYLQRPLETLNLITLHLGNGASAAAVGQGKSLDTSMGLTPLEGLIMGTRSGDLDPAVVFYLVRASGRSSDEIESMLNKESGLKGICGENDMREIIERARSEDPQACLALEMYAYRIKKYIGAYTAALGRLDAVVFTAGIGENSALIRALCCKGLVHMGIEVDPRKNESGQAGAFEIQTDESRVRVLVVPTDEELEIAQEAVETIRANRSAPSDRACVRPRSSR